MLGADTRSTSGSTVADKNCEKIHYIAPNIYCCGAGTAADTMNVTAMISSALELHRYGTGRASRVATAMTMLKSHLFRYQGHVSAALVLGGVDLHGPHLFTVRRRRWPVVAVAGLGRGWRARALHSPSSMHTRVRAASSTPCSSFRPTHPPHPPQPPPSNHQPTASPRQIFPHGSTDSLPYATMGSGSLNAMAVFEAGFKEDMAKDEAMALVAAAIRSGVYNDLGSGSNVDLCVITKDGVEYLRNHEFLQGKTYSRAFPVRYAKGTAPVIKERVIPLSAVEVAEGDEMDTS